MKPLDVTEDRPVRDQYAKDDPSFAGYTLRDLIVICRQRRSNPHVYRSAAMAALPYLVARLKQELDRATT